MSWLFREQYPELAAVIEATVLCVCFFFLSCCFSDGLTFLWQGTQEDAVQRHHFNIIVRRLIWISLQSRRLSCQIEELKQEVLDRAAFRSPPRRLGSAALSNYSEKSCFNVFCACFPTKPISGLTDARRCRRATFKKSLEDKMCVTRHSRLPPSVRADIFVNTGANRGALHFTWHFVLQRCTPLQLHLLFMKSHLHSHYNKCQQSKGPTCFSMSVITRNLSWCCVKDCPLHSLCFFPSVFFFFYIAVSAQSWHRIQALPQNLLQEIVLAWAPTKKSQTFGQNTTSVYSICLPVPLHSVTLMSCWPGTYDFYLSLLCNFFLRCCLNFLNATVHECGSYCVVTRSPTARWQCRSLILASEEK